MKVRQESILQNICFFGEEVFKKVKNLSGGEKSRLCLCKIMYDDVNLLILDEPTNHLDIDSREILEQCLKEFEGTIFFVSHDRYFINQLCNGIVELNNGKLNSYLGNYDYYKEKKNEEKNKIKIVNDKTISRKKSKNIDEDKRLKNKEKKVKDLESEISVLEVRLKDIEEEMISHSIDYESLNRLYEEKICIENALQNLIEKWEQLI